MSITSRFVVLLLLALFPLIVPIDRAEIAAAATPGEVSEFAVPRLCTHGQALTASATEGSMVTRICEAPAHFAYEPSTLAILTASGEIAERPISATRAGPILTGPAGAIWFAANAGEFTKDPVSVNRLSADGTVDSFPIAIGSEPKIYGLVNGPEGSVWAAVGTGVYDEAPLGRSRGGGLVRIARDGTETTFSVPHEIEPRGLALGADGNLWFTGIRGRVKEEKYLRRGVGYVGRMTRTGGLTLFKIPTDHPEPRAIAAGPDGTIWFGESAAGRIGTIGTDGFFGRRIVVRSAPEEISVGPEGDAWFGTGHLVRLTAAGQRTDFPLSARTATVGSEGAIWFAGSERVGRIFPGAPGLDVWRVAVDRRSRAADIRLACGGSATGCDGHLELALGVGHGRRPVYRFGGADYSVAAGSRRTVTVEVPAKAFAVASRPLYEGHRLKLLVRATVEGGPPLERWLAVPWLVTK